ncbi:hypothetical protein [Actinocorallia longicatena]|uniref:Flagellar biosynthetic protein FliP n=1 Tax=Actinocorallia longicatena TaxID=111803 RepID=A0ABP6QD67_9ACTN
MHAQEEIARTRHGGGWGHFARHYMEMVIAMAVGMLVLGAAVGLVGGGFDADRRPEAASLTMVAEMSAGMLMWMRIRGHRWAGALEMCGAMAAPLLVLFPLLWLDVIGAESMIMLEHLVMLPLMLVVMLRRRGEYGFRQEVSPS